MNCVDILVATMIGRGLVDGSMVGILRMGATRGCVSDESLFGVIDNVGVCHIIGHGGALIGFNSL